MSDLHDANCYTRRSWSQIVATEGRRVSVGAIEASEHDTTITFASIMPELSTLTTRSTATGQMAMPDASRYDRLLQERRRRR